MSQTIQGVAVGGATENLGAALQRGLSRLAMRLRDARASRLSAAEFEAMSPAQRKDVGAGTPNRPTIELPAGLMTTLMSMR
jgi:hypothetical protein